MENAPGWDTPMWHTTGFRLIKLGELVQATTSAVFGPQQITSRQFHVLSAAEAMPHLSQKELSRVLGVDPNVMVGLIDDLEEQGLARRERNPRDRRRYIVTPTDKARTLLGEARDAVARAESEFFATLSGSEVALLHELSGRLLTEHPRLTKYE
ncbi:MULTISPECIES: MarR family winged helix-turn-helix transcriptional regulator [Nocardiopsis]|uniref:Transcriptional regulator, MarR family n=1 Tax=Nocardiopsis dassonvillei (strain ATCC 23218 / DSM 43111 / CIP 107115 / JCM 7437 / KCTC 9190 / NBRC 14626 / NCTC 10488 / NRRL B-5397 / IMRU 509) TaxID=446468 RepID=D7AZY1_NOCDD|nr:MarR family transcriptional regulator [Nocardiopsis dassonvillei]ADH68252.1 transcriptional regulator, MarR family [Nocardiopsis dassonvillei subsp. dassonvillei DSM 43111]NKY78343.1 MarR family transcriptional regulator [Nocardiopsis dassonvillei]VEI88756.1 Salmolysin [Nocardiopsis dassonvillei]